MKKLMIASVISATVLSGCSTMSDRDKRAGSIATGALAGVMLANQFTDNPAAKVAVGALGGLIGNQIYKEAQKDFQNDKDVQVKKTQIDGQDAINLSIRNVHFKVNSANLSFEDKQRLQKVANILKNKNVRIIVVGHTDSTGPSDYNMELSLARAQSVADFLAMNGVDYSRIDIRGKGETQPIADNSTPEGRAQNRRVEIYVIPLD